jgi:hypothetical protein
MYILSKQTLKYQYYIKLKKKLQLIVYVGYLI